MDFFTNDSTCYFLCTLRTQTLSTMSFTPYGGCFIAFTIAISANVNVSNAA